MRRTLLLVLLLALPARGGEEEPKDPVDLLPKALRPGAAATFFRAAGDGRLKGTVTFRAEKGEEEGTVRLVREYDSGDQGPLTLRDRLTAVLDARTVRVVSFAYETGGKETPLREAARLGPHPEREGLLHERIRYDAKGKPRITKTRIAPPEGEEWVPDLLEPFLWKPEFRLLTVERGVLLGTPVEYELLGQGEMDLGGEEVPCQIWTRVHGESNGRVYVRIEDRMPLKHGPARLRIRVEE